MKFSLSKNYCRIMCQTLYINIVLPFLCISYLINWFIKSHSSSSVSVGEANFFLRSVAAGSSPLILERWPVLLETVETLAWGRRSGKRAWHTASVPKKFTLIVFSACSPNGSLAFCCWRNKKITDLESPLNKMYPIPKLTVLYFETACLLEIANSSCTF